MQTQHIALVPEAGGLSSSELLRVSAALQRQVSSQFGPIWELHGTVDAFAEIEDVPAGYWPIVLSPQERGGVAAGIHLDQNGQPYARVKLAPGWSLDASRACLEMLANPFGRRTLNAQSPRSDQGPAEILLEVCGAFGDVARAYVVNDVAVADFCTPAFFDAPARRANERYSYRGGSFGAPMQLLRGGHLAWFDAISNSWWLRSFHDEHPSDLSLGTMRLNADSVRELVLRHEPERPLSLLRQESLNERVGLSWLGEQGSAASRARAERLRALLVGTDEADRIVVDVPAALHVEARAHNDEAHRNWPLARFASKATLQGPPFISAAEEIEDELRAVVAAEIDAAMDVADEPVAPEPAAVPAPAPAPVAARAAVRKEREPVVPPARAESKEPRQAPTQPSIPSTPSIPPPLHRRPSSIAPIAMLDSAARPTESRMGMILTGAAVLALALAVFARGNGSRSADVPPPQAAALPAAPAPSPTKVDEVPAPPENLPAPAAKGARPVAQNKSEAGLASAREKREQTSADPSAAKASAREGEKREQASAAERRRDARALAREQGLAKTSANQPASSSAPGEVPPAAAIEGLFDTRR